MDHVLHRRRPPKLLALLGLAAALVGLVALSASPGRAQAAPATPTVSAQTFGNSIYFYASTSEAVSWEIQVSTTRAATGTPPSFGSIVVQKASSNGARQTSFSHLFSKQAPNTMHYYIVKATDAKGLSSYSTGSLKTLNRALSVTFSKIHVIDDADEWYRGKGEINFFFDLNGCWQHEWNSGYRSLDNGDSYYPNRTQSFPLYNAAVVDLAVSGWESDDDFWDFSPGWLTPANCEPKVPTGISANPLYKPEYSNSDGGNGAQAATRLNFFKDFSHVQNTATEKVTIETPAGAKLKFRAEITLTFSYFS